jgi:hypothetical protein
MAVAERKGGGMSGTLADRLDAARRRAFVGRAAELRLVAAMLDGTEQATVLHIHGPGGVGKSTLLRRVAWEAEAAGRTPIWADGRDGHEPVTAVGPAGVLLLDEVDALPGRREDVLEDLLAGLPTGAVAVLAGREPPPSTWRTDPGWRSVVRTVLLGNLDDADGRELLRLRGLPEPAHEQALAFTHGHPLALALLADVGLGGSAPSAAGPATPEVLAALLDSLIGAVPSPVHMAALEACAQVAVTTEPLLAALLGITDVREVFDWLRDLAIIDFSARGLYPHDVAREALARELRWRHPDGHARLQGRARAYYERQLAGADPVTGRRVIFDFAFLHRHSPVLGPVLRHVNPADDADGLSTGPVGAGEWPVLRSIVAAHEGAESAALAAHWAQAQPESVTVVRDPDGRPAGLLVAPALDRASDAQRAADPVAAAAWAAAQRAPARESETVLLVRHWADARVHQAVSPVQTHVMLHLVRSYLATPRLAQVYVCFADPQFWAGAMAYTDFHAVPGEIVVDGRGYGLFVHDWRAVPPLAWMALIAGRAAGTDPSTRSLADPPREFDEAEFAAAVRSALRDVSRPDRLREAALGRSRAVRSRLPAGASAADRGRAVSEIVLAAAHVLERSPRDRRGYRALYHTYLQPAPTQAAAAELLGLPTTTYRRHLAAGIDRLVELLWQEENG